MKIETIAWDSFSVRSTATVVELNKEKIFIDPGIAIGPKRYGKGPSEIEMKELALGIERIKKELETVTILTISHYHYDHYIPECEGYFGKTLFIKDPKNNINASQKSRAKKFIDFVKNRCDIKILDNVEDVIKGSPSVFHGEEHSKLGYVAMLSIESGEEKMIHASDVQGPGNDLAKEWIIQEDPTILMLSGYPSIFVGWRKKKSDMLKAFERLEEIMAKTRVKKIVLDHHIARDLKYHEIIKEIRERGKEMGCWIGSAATFSNKKERFLEAHRLEFSKT